MVPTPTAELMRRDLAAVWHPFTQHALWPDDELLGKSPTPLAGADSVLDVWRCGTMTGVEVRAVGERTGFEVCRAARRRGVIVRPLGDVVVLMPPPGISDDELAELAEAVFDSVIEVVR